MFFVLLSTIFWIMQIYRQKFEATQTIPVKYINVPDSILFVNELPSHINARIKEDGIILFRYFFNKRNDTLHIDIRELIQESPTRLVQGSIWEQLIKNKLYSTSELISYNPSYISFQYTALNEKQLPVIYDGYIDLNLGQHIIDGDLRIDPEYVKAYGSKESLDTIRYAHTLSDTLKGITGDKTIQIDLRQIEGVKFVPNKVKVTIPVDQYVEKEVEVPITCINLPKDLTARFFPPAVKIPLSVGVKRYKDITVEDFDVIVDYNDIKNLTEPTIAVRIVNSPDFVRAKSPNPAEVEFILEQNTYSSSESND